MRSGQFCISLVSILLIASLNVMPVLGSDREIDQSDQSQFKGKQSSTSDASDTQKPSGEHIRRVNQRITCPIGIGPGAIINTERVTLGKFPSDGKWRVLDCRSKSKQFAKIRLWMFHNIGAPLGCAPRDVDINAEYQLTLFSKRLPGHSLLDSLLVIIELTPESLGPEYKTKINELERLMSKNNP